MIDPTNTNHRARLQKSVQHWHNALDVYRKQRREAIMRYTGSVPFAQACGAGASKEIWGNLIQMAALARVINLTYGEPRYVVVPNQPLAQPTAGPLQEFLNKWVQLIGLGATARQIGLDSCFGWGIFHTSISKLPAAARAATGLEAGPMVQRVSQDNFLFDGSATRWQDVGYVGHTFEVPLDEAMNFTPFLEYNPEATQALAEYSRAAMTSARINQSAGRDDTPQAMTKLVEIYFPRAGKIATWAVRDAQLGGITERPLYCRPHEGHYDGPYDVLGDLDIPDNLYPIPQSESSKALHTLFNELCDKTSDQARLAKTNPIHEIGADRDMQKLEEAGDRESVPVANIQRIGMWQLPGPDQGTTAFMHAALQMFKEFSGNLDDALGLAPTAPTGKQSELIRQSNSARSAELRQRMDRCLSSVARKLSHIVLNDRTIALPARRSIPGTTITLDMGWRQDIPRDQVVDDYLINVVAGSTAYRPPEARLQEIEQAVQSIAMMAQLTAQGAPFNLSEFVELQATYRDLPELRAICSQLLPEYEAKVKETANLPDPNKGIYHRVNHTEKTNDGALTQNLTQQGDSPSGVMRPAA